MSDEFRNFLRGSLDRKSIWISSILTLYDAVEFWLEPMVYEKLIMIKRVPIEVKEEGLGTYQTFQLDLIIKDRTVSLIPDRSKISGFSHVGWMTLKGNKYDYRMFQDDLGHWYFYGLGFDSTHRPFNSKNFQTAIQRIL